MSNTIGDGPIEPKYADQMRDLARALDEILNGDKKGEDREVGFILMMFDMNSDSGRCNYISNSRRDDVVVMLKEQLARFEGQPEIKGGQQ